MSSAWAGPAENTIRPALGEAATLTVVGGVVVVGRDDVVTDDACPGGWRETAHPPPTTTAATMTAPSRHTMAFVRIFGPIPPGAFPLAATTAGRLRFPRPPGDIAPTRAARSPSRTRSPTSGYLPQVCNKADPVAH